jgi:hypothetical protein
MATTQTKPLTNLQLELLRVFSREVSVADLIEIWMNLRKFCLEAKQLFCEFGGDTTESRSELHLNAPKA